MMRYIEYPNSFSIGEMMMRSFLQCLVLSSAISITHAQTPPSAVTDSSNPASISASTANLATKTEIVTSGDLPEVDASKIENGVLAVSQIKELLNGRQLTGWAQYQGNSNFDTYRFYADGTALFTTKGAFNSYRYKGTGRWVARKSGAYEAICWDIKGTWENRSCSSVMVSSGKVMIGSFFKQSDK